MCGIAGCLALSLEADPDQQWVRTATERIGHRGPDDDGYYADPDVALGYQRLSIIDLSPGGHQPMQSADGRYWMVYNGEIYNYLELGEQLREQGVQLRSSSDSEVLLETYARVGKDVVHRLRGMFAFAIWDTWTRELFCARDPFGIKPFYYAVDAHRRGRGTSWGTTGGAAAAGPAAAGAAPAWDAFTPAQPGAGGVDQPAQPGYAGQGYSAPGSGGQGYGAVSQGGQGYDAPGYGAPGYGGQGYDAPGYDAPGYEGQGYEPRGYDPAGGPPSPDGEHPGGWSLRFASERKALADPGELRELDPDALRRYLSFQYVPAPATLTPPIQVLPSGHAMIARPGGNVDVYRYWRADLRPVSAGREGTPRSILAVMRDSVAVHLRSDAPLGAFLSGGIDSAAICALAAEHRPDLLTFTVGFEREGYSEIDRAQETAAALGVKSQGYVISQEEFFRHLPQIIWHLDDPMADAAAIPLWFVAREASRHVKVVLSGEGADELFGGYAIYHQPGMVRAAERLPGWGRMPIKRAAELIPPGVRGRGLLERTSTPLRHRYIGNAHVSPDGLVDELAGSGPATPYDVTDPVYDQAAEAGLDDVATMQLIDINTWLQGDILVKADRMTMAHSLELRVPFLDREVMAVAARLARDEKIGAGTTKAALRTAMSEVLPRAAAERAKLGFPVPIGHWLKGDAYGYADALLRQAQTDRWINRQAALRLLERFRAGDPEVTWRQIWVLLVFSIWHQIYVERGYDPVALGWDRAAGAAR
ncbi:MAG: asparagine synthase (glutamine-hydrolyzing) [Nocardiopsaceae bacterium]|jgi:asparagine synthase (glutamine-hydrolysing)|nr:asparagine synthase (glutamine-hydrolyzing) [Nocardiopsaceae bacterium]